MNSGKVTSPFMQRRESCPTVSVIIPTFNRESTLRRAIDSVLSQTFQDFELVIVDDGSSDGTSDAIATYGDDRIIYMRHDANVGQSVACNTGIQIARGEIVSFLDSDDLWISTYLSKVVEAFEARPSVGFVYCRLLRGPHWQLEGDDQYGRVLEQGHLSATITLSVRKAVLHRVGGFNPRYSVCNDDDLCFRLSREYSFALIPEALAIVGGASDSMCGDRVRLALGWEQLFTEYKSDIVQHCGYRVLAAHLVKLASLHLRCGRIRAGSRHLIIATGYFFKTPREKSPLSKRELVGIPLTVLRSLGEGLAWRLRER